MSNRDTIAAWRYHDATKHSYMSVRTDLHHLDWSNQPLPYKLYGDLQPIPLPNEWPASGVPALAAISQPLEPRPSSGPQTADVGLRTSDAVPTRQQLAWLLYLSAGITKRRRLPGGELVFRAASCTGALYEIELYLVCGRLPDLDAGVYHFNPADFALRALRQGDYRDVVVRAAGSEDAIRHAPATIVCSATYWRNAWKYRARTYRHFGWDNGTILANLLAACRAIGLPARTIVGFTDESVNQLLALDPLREVSFSLVAIGSTAEPPPASGPVAPVSFTTAPLSAHEVDYPLMREVHAASSLVTDEEVVGWRQAARTLASDLAGRRSSDQSRDGSVVTDLEPGDASGKATDLLEEVIQRRGSTRQFDRAASWSFEQFATTLGRATREIDADFLGPRGTGSPSSLTDLYVIVHAVDDLAPGAYVLHRSPCQLELLKEGRFRHEAGYLGLEQDLPADACAVVFFLADLRMILDRLGNRGYRATQLEAGIVGGRLYLASYAQRLGASGLTFYDDDVASFFSPHAEGKSAIFCMTLGKAVKRG
ncbi:MAG: SagB/ThcOx family dehydrogenase [Acidobacteria bacterium]|nr:SagB/ThcOx family dehydrogenase [Acidobacteriota bacterium]